jgi:aquaporin Z
MTRPVRLITELVGTFIFLSVIALSGPAGPLAPLAIGTALMAMVYMGGHISGAHYNPAVSFGAFLSRKLGAVDMAGYFGWPNWSVPPFASGAWSNLWIYVVNPLSRP